MKELTVNGRPIDYSELPEHMRGAMQRYMEHGIEPGSFLMSVLSNDFMGAVGRADSTNKHRLADYATWLYNFAPPASFGSPAKVDAWVELRQSIAA